MAVEDNCMNKIGFVCLFWFCSKMKPNYSALCLITIVAFSQKCMNIYSLCMHRCGYESYCQLVTFNEHSMKKNPNSKFTLVACITTHFQWNWPSNLPQIVIYLFIYFFNFPDKSLNCFTHCSEWQHFAADRRQPHIQGEKNTFLGQSPSDVFPGKAMAFLKKSARHYVCTLCRPIECCHSN